MQHVVKLLAVLSLLLLPMRIAEAHDYRSPDALMAALDLGHCSGGEADKQHGRAHVHCSVIGEIIADSATLDARLPIAKAPMGIPVGLGSIGLGPQAATPPPRAL